MNNTSAQIQIIYDEIVMMMAVSRAYRNKPVKFIAATSIEQALEQMKTFSFNLFLLDLDIKSFCSFEILKIITKSYPLIPVILMTTSDIESKNLNSKLEKLCPKSSRYLIEKPFDYKNLIVLIDKLLRIK